MAGKDGGPIGGTMARTARGALLGKIGHVGGGHGTGRQRSERRRAPPQQQRRSLPRRQRRRTRLARSASAPLVRSSAHLRMAWRLTNEPRPDLRRWRGSREDREGGEDGDWGACSHQPPPPAQRQFDVDYFLNYTEMLGESFQQHNQALKWWRHECEDAAEPFQRSSVKVFNNMTPTWGCVCVHDPGMNFLFSEESVPWRWQEMVAMLRDEDIRKVVGGARGDGFLMGCSLELRPNSYDHFRSHALAKRLGPKKVTVQLPMWDFVLHRDDGTGVRLHPHWSDRKVDAFDLLPHADTVQPPKAGLGQSDGAGTFRHYAGLGVQRKYRFDASKEKQGSAWFGSSGASASSTAVSAWCLVARRDAMGEEAAARGSAAAGSAAASGLAAAGLS